MPRPSSFLPMYLVVLSTTEGLLSDKKCSNSFSISLICVTVRLGMTVAMCVNLGIHSVEVGCVAEVGVVVVDVVVGGVAAVGVMFGGEGELVVIK